MPTQKSKVRAARAHSFNSSEIMFPSTQQISTARTTIQDIKSKPTDDVIPQNHAPESPIHESVSAITLPPPATGRAVDYRPAYSLTQLFTPGSKGTNHAPTKPVIVRPVKRPSNVGGNHRAGAVVYPSYQASRIPTRAEINKLNGKGKFTDRFTPSEAVVSNAFKKDRKPSASRPVGQPSNRVPTFVPNNDLYSFPPNLNSRYPSPTDLRQAAPSDTITSYLPPAAGPLDTGKFVGPVNPDLLPDSMKGIAPVEEAKDMAGGGYIYDAPAPPNQLDPDMGAMVDDKEPEPQAPGGDDDGDMDAPSPSADAGAIDDGVTPPDHDIGGYSDDKEYPTPPPGYEEDHPHDHHHHHDHDHDHDHGHDHDHYPAIDFAQGPYLNDHPHYYDHHYDHHFDHHLPDVVYDDYHDHFHHDHHEHIIEHHPEPITTTEPPPPPPPAPEQPRVKKYSYFYIGRKLWYIPLYFTLWFTFYVLWLILKSIARHKVNLPNHYVARRSIEMSHREAREAIDKLTIRVLDGIEQFKLKYIG